MGYCSSAKIRGKTDQHRLPCSAYTGCMSVSLTRNWQNISHRHLYFRGWGRKTQSRAVEHLVTALNGCRILISLGWQEHALCQFRPFPPTPGSLCEDHGGHLDLVCPPFRLASSKRQPCSLSDLPASHIPTYSASQGPGVLTVTSDPLQGKKNYSAFPGSY